MNEEIAVKPQSPESKHLFKKIPLWARIIFFVIFGLILFILLLWGLGNAFKFVIYRDFYNRRENVCAIPGLNDGAVQQGITLDDDNNFICSTYMMDEKSPSRIYITNKKGDVRYVELYEDNELKTPCTRHCGGIQYVASTGKVYIADAKQYVLTLDYEALMKANSGKLSIRSVCEPIQVNNQASSIFSDETYVYVSEFHRDGSDWKASNEITYNDIKHHAICSVYTVNKDKKSVDFTKPIRQYSIPDNAQGVAFNDNYFYYCTSWGINSSHIFKYELDKIVKIDDYKGVETYFVENNPIYDLKCPPMFEDLDVDSDGRIITYTECACNKYIFGKFFFANSIYAIKL